MNRQKKKFIETGFKNFGSILNKKKSQKLKQQIQKLRKLHKNIFYETENEFKKRSLF